MHLPSTPTPSFGGRGSDVAGLGEGSKMELEWGCCSRERFGVPGVLDPWAGSTGRASAWSRQDMGSSAAQGRK